ncbi:MAG: hypothetical protein QOI39_3533 [Mycobacterium sp.]|jgi:hypothetical protein|nr:hypothetical protein [Mycobacterium sp.]
MYGDFSRLTFDPANGYTGVWNQQGRIQLDADNNELTAIMLHWMRTLATDFIGPAGGHIERAGFKISLDDDDLVLSTGHYYVAGIRCEIPDVDAKGDPNTVTYSSLRKSGQDDIPERGPYVVYLQAWESTVNQLLDDRLIEPALGPTSPDTTIRTKMSWTLGFITEPFEAVPPATLAEVVTEHFAKLNSPVGPRLRAQVAEDGNVADPDEAATLSGYSGLENQLYRIEVHRGSDVKNGPTFKWSRDNGCVQFGIANYEVLPDNGIRVTLSGAPLPGRPRLAIGDCVEVIDQSWRPFGEPGPLCTVMEVRGPDAAAGSDDKLDAANNPAVLRRWDSVPEKGNGLPVKVSKDREDPWTDIENGIQIQFTASDDAVFGRGDFWLIPARAATSQIYGPTAAPEGAGSVAFGPQRHFAPLAQVDGANITDLRSLFTHLAWPDSPGG